jgi:alpha-D-ribose 1-methylphosphonate 5-triphosphate diphosphatase PhnM
MNQEYLDFNSYTLAGRYPVPSGKDLIIPDSFERTQTMLVKWQIRQLAKGGSIDLIPPATLSAVLEIPGLGELDTDEYQIKASIQGRDRVQIITLDPSLPYKLTLSEIDSSVTNSVLEFYTSNLAMGTFNNPGNVATDFSPLIDAINASSEAQIEATEAHMGYLISVVSSGGVQKIAINLQK